MEKIKFENLTVKQLNELGNQYLFKNKVKEFILNNNPSQISVLINSKLEQIASIDFGSDSSNYDYFDLGLFNNNTIRCSNSWMYEDKLQENTLNAFKSVFGQYNCSQPPKFKNQNETIDFFNKCSHELLKTISRSYVLNKQSKIVFSSGDSYYNKNRIEEFLNFVFTAFHLHYNEKGDFINKFYDAMVYKQLSEQKTVIEIGGYTIDVVYYASSIHIKPCKELNDFVFEMLEKYCK